VTRRTANTMGLWSRRLSLARSLDHTDRLLRAAYALCGSPADAEDLVREAFARALRKRRLLRRGGDAVYLMRALRLSWIDLHREVRPPRRDRPPPEAIDWVVDGGRDPDVLALDVELAYDAVARLSPRQRKAIAAVDVLGLSHRDAARALRIRQRTLTSRLHRARERIAAALEGVSL
jgi:RNA polymerase sigma-70 factor (ECF subfamily)